MARKNLQSLKDEVFLWTGLDPNDDDHNNIVESSINRVYQSIINEENWYFLKKESNFNTVAPVTAGTISTTGTSVSGSGTNFDSSMEGRYLWIKDNNDEIHQISSVTNSTTLTLASSPSSDVSGSDYSIFQPDYEMDSGIDPFNIEYIVDTDDSTLLSSVPNLTNEKVRPNHGTLNTNPPRWWSPMGTSNSGNLFIRLYPIPDDVRTLRVVAHDDASNLENDTDEHVLPERYENVLLFGVFSRVFAWIGRQDRADLENKNFFRGLKKMKRDNRKLVGYGHRMVDQTGFHHHVDETFAPLRLPPEYGHRVL